MHVALLRCRLIPFAPYFSVGFINRAEERTKTGCFVDLPDVLKAATKAI
jgi:hypothetical protein